MSGGGVTAATADIVISGGAITAVTLGNKGCFYAVNNQLSVDSSFVGGTGAGFVLTVNTVTNPTGTTWLGDNFDTALFNGTMMEAIRYMKGDADLVQFYQQQYTQAMALLKNLGDGKQRMDAYRDGQVRNPVI